jgi:Flp pilus assembly protein TadG
MGVNRSTSRNKRQGAAAVEFAVVAPLLFLVIVGAIEFGRAMMSLELLSNAARQGARTGVLASSSNSTITSAVNTSLANAGITGANSPTIKVNGQSVDASTAVTGDQITVTVSVPASNITWLPVSWFLSGKTLSQTVVMRRE